MEKGNYDKLILAFFQDKEYCDAVRELKANDFDVTVLRPGNRFLPAKNATILIALRHESLDKALSLLEKYKTRTVNECEPIFTSASLPCYYSYCAEIPKKHGGVELIISDIGEYRKI